MGNRMKGNKIKNNALEVIMRDVLHGMLDFTGESSSGSKLVNLEITSVKSPSNANQVSALILPFPQTKKTASK